MADADELEPNARSAAMILMGLLTTPVSGLEKFRNSRLGRASGVEIDDLQKVRAHLLIVHEAITKADHPFWKRIDGIAPSPLDAQSSLAAQSPIEASPVSAAPVSAAPVSAAPVSAAPASAPPVSAAPIRVAPVRAPAVQLEEDTHGPASRPVALAPTGLNSVASTRAGLEAEPDEEETSDVLLPPKVPAALNEVLPPAEVSRDAPIIQSGPQKDAGVHPPPRDSPWLSGFSTAQPAMKAASSPLAPQPPPPVAPIGAAETSDAMRVASPSDPLPPSFVVPGPPPPRLPNLRPAPMSFEDPPTVFAPDHPNVSLIEEIEAEDFRTTLDPEVDEDRGSALPFARLQAPPERAQRQSVIPPGLPFKAPQKLEPYSTLADYTVLCVLAAAHPDRADSVYHRFGIGDAAGRSTLHARWRDRFSSSVRERLVWQRLSVQLKRWLIDYPAP